MKQTAGGVEDSDTKCDILKKTSVNCFRQIDNTSVTKNFEQDSEMGKTDYEKKDVGMDAIIDGVGGFQISEDSCTTSSITRMLCNLRLENGKNAGVKNLILQEPEINKVTEVKNFEETNILDNLVTLEAPTLDDDEEAEEDELSAPEDDADDKLGERGPTHGIPSNYVPESGRIYTAYGMQPGSNTVAMPSNFPDYDSQNSCFVSMKGPKRGMDEVCPEPLKYTRPDDAMKEEVSCLTAPWDVTGVGVGSVKTISQVNPRQMTGGTVYTAANTTSCSGQNINDFTNGQLSHLTIDFLSGELLKEEHAVPSLNLQNVNLLQRPGYSQAYGSSSAATLSHVNSQCQEFDKYQQFNSVRLDKHRSTDDASEGYASDFSPLNDIHSSPFASPLSMMTPSPPTLFGSPPPTYWSVPPSDRSSCSVDSGIPSPASDDISGCPAKANCPVTATSCSSYPFDESCPDKSTTDDYHSPFINEHRQELLLVLETIGEDLKHDQMKKRLSVTSVTRDAAETTTDKDNARSRTTCNGLAAHKAVMSPQVAVNIPTVVPAFVSLDTSAKAASSNVRESNWDSTVEVPKTSHIVTAQVSDQPQPIVNSQGKVAIPPNKPHKPQSASHAGPYILSADGTMTPLIFLPQQPPPKTPKKIAPKEIPSTPKENITGSQAGQSGKVPDTSSVDDKKKVEGRSQMRRQNLARRLVAEMSASDLEDVDYDGNTCLAVAVCATDDEFLVQAILERLSRCNLSAMINAQNNRGQTALYLATSSNNAPVVQLLVDHGADVNLLAESATSAGDSEKLAAIHCACSRGEGYLSTLRALLRAPRLDLDLVNSSGHTALHSAILAHGKMGTDGTRINSIPIIQALIQAGADSDLQVQQSGKTALMFALESHDLDLIENIFHLIEPSKLAAALKTQDLNSSSCLKIAESLKTTLDHTGQQRLDSCLWLGTTARVVLGSS